VARTQRRIVMDKLLDSTLQHPRQSRDTEGFPPLVDPVSGRRLRRERDALVAGDATARYPVTGGIARVIPGGANYAAAFGEQWNRWRRTQLDSHTGLPISRNRLLRCIGDELAHFMSAPEGRIDVLEAGCGAGRFTEVLLDMPAVRLTSVDLSSAVKANQANFPQDARHRIVQCDICQPPFAGGSFDAVICLGVIQHTPDPERTIASLFSLVKPGGWLVIDHYLRSWKIWLRVTANAMRPFVKRMPPKRRMRFCERLTDWVLPVHRVLRGSRMAQMALSRVSPLLTYYHVYPGLSDEFQREWALLDTHDSLTDWFKHLRTPAQIRATLESLGARDIAVAPGGVGVEARCRRGVPHR
jgi:SAM-dependent methyltransferase